MPCGHYCPGVSTPPPVPHPLASAVADAGHTVATGLLPGGGAASAVLGASIILGMFTGVIALETHRSPWVGMVVGFLTSLVVLTALHALAVA